MEYYKVKESVRRRARSASNMLCLPCHSIWTDNCGSVLDVNRGFIAFTGYTRKEMLGRKCSFLQGKDTDPEDVLQLRLAMEDRRPTSVVILNYRKDGSPFWNVLTIRPYFEKGLRNKVEKFSSEIIGLPVPPRFQNHPKLCLEDALSLISVFSSVPRTMSTNPAENDDSDVSSDVEIADTPPIYKHINYSTVALPQDEDRKPTITSLTAGKRYVFVAETSLPTEKGRFRVRAYRDPLTGAEPLAIIVGKVEGGHGIVCRVHDQCVTSEVLGSLRCDCKQQLDYAMNFIQGNKLGMVLYLPQEGRGIGLANKVAAYAAQEAGFDTVDANRVLGFPDDARSYDSVRDILDDLEIKSIKLLTNNPRKIECLEALGITISSRLPCVCKPMSDFSRNYVQAKAERMGHMINISCLQVDTDH